MFPKTLDRCKTFTNHVKQKCFLYYGPLVNDSWLDSIHYSNVSGIDTYLHHWAVTEDRLKSANFSLTFNRDRQDRYKRVELRMELYCLTGTANHFLSVFKEIHNVKPTILKGEK